MKNSINGEEIIRLRKNQGFSQNYVSRQLGISTTKLSKYERNIDTMPANLQNEFRKLLDSKSRHKVNIKTKQDQPEKLGDNNHIIYFGETTQVLDLIPDNSIDLIFVDPPYNLDKEFEEDEWKDEEEYIHWVKSWLDVLILKLKPNGTLYFMAATQFMPYFDIYLQKKMNILSRIIWYYDSSARQAKKYFGSLYEPILHCVKDKNNYTFNSQDILIEAKTGSKRKLIDYRKQPPQQYNETKVPGNVWQFPRVRFRMNEYEKHPSQKPEMLLERIILASSNPGDIVLDPFAGTFTTSRVAKETKRKSISIENNHKYVKIGLKRLGFN